MSTYKVPITTIREVLPHPNADRLEIVKCYDWMVVTQKDTMQVGDMVIYIPVDSIMPGDLETFLFPPDSKIKLNKSRVRSIKIRGHISQGMVIRPEKLPAEIMTLPKEKWKEDVDVADILKLTKYEPPEDHHQGTQQAKKVRKDNPNFPKYTSLENFKWYDRIFQDGETVYISEKLHGSQWRAGWFKNEPNTLWKKIKKFFGFLSEWEFCWGSHNVQIQCKLYHRGYYSEDIYTKMVKQYNLKEIIPKGLAVYGEVVGDGIQKGYTYGCGPGEHKLYVYDVMKDGKWLNFVKETGGYGVTSFLEAVHAMKLDPVPCLYVGPFSKEILDKHRDGDSMIGGQKVREGVVIKPVVEAECCVGRKVLKAISDAYYLTQDNTDFH